MSQGQEFGVEHIVHNIIKRVGLEEILNILCTGGGYAVIPRDQTGE